MSTPLAGLSQASRAVTVSLKGVPAVRVDGVGTVKEFRVPAPTVRLPELPVLPLGVTDVAAIEVVWES